MSTLDKPKNIRFSRWVSFLVESSGCVGMKSQTNWVVVGGDKLGSTEAEGDDIILKDLPCHQQFKSMLL